jgi:hypothetical protein
MWAKSARRDGVRCRVENVRCLIVQHHSLDTAAWPAIGPNARRYKIINEQSSGVWAQVVDAIDEVHAVSCGCGGLYSKVVLVGKESRGGTGCQDWLRWLVLITNTPQMIK